MDVKTAFLIRKHDKEIYMKQPVGFEIIGAQCMPLKMFRKWSQAIFQEQDLKLSQANISIDFETMEENHCACVKRNQDFFVILSLYADEILLTGNNLEMLNEIKWWLPLFLK